jgi:hypothetical protein
MATSGTYSWTSSRDSVITGAFRKIGRLGDTETISGTADPRLTAGINALNPLVKSLHADGMPLWALKDITIPMSTFFNIATNAYISIGPGATINQIDQPLKVVQALRRDNSTTPIVDVPMNIYTWEDYERLSYKNTQGAPIHIFHKPERITSNLAIWPLPDSYWNTNGLLYIRYQRPFQDFNAGTDEPDFPNYWHLPLIYLLASLLAPEYGVPLPDRQLLDKQASDMKEHALEFGTEEGSLYLHPQHRWN